MGAEEHRVEVALAKGAARHGWLCWKLTSPNLNGVPDRLVVADAGVCAFVECKTEAGRLRPQQKIRLAELREHGQLAFTCHGEKEAKAILSAIESAVENARTDLKE